MENKGNEFNFWHSMFLISNGINLIYGLFLLILFSIFVAKNKFGDHFTIFTIIFLIYYSLVSVIGQLWLKKSLCLNNFYTVLIFLVYLVFFFVGWSIIINSEWLRDGIINIFENSNISVNAIYEIINNEINNFKIGIIINSVLFVNNLF